jgi:hypothetical protein
VLYLLYIIYADLKSMTTTVLTIVILSIQIPYDQNNDGHLDSNEDKNYGKGHPMILFSIA